MIAAPEGFDPRLLGITNEAQVSNPFSFSSSYGRVFLGAPTSIFNFFKFEELKNTWRLSLLNSTMYRWTRLDFLRVSGFYSKYLATKFKYKGTQKSGTRLNIFKSFPDSIQFDFVEEVRPSAN